MANDTRPLFRQKSLDRIASPEQLNDYLRVSTPSVWAVLIAIAILLAGVCVWGMTGQLETRLSAVAAISDGAAIVYVREDDAAAVQAGMPVSVGGHLGTVAVVGAQPVPVDESFSAYMRHVGSFQSDEWVWPVTLDISCPDGVYAAQIVTESVSPMSFVLN